MCLGSTRTLLSRLLCAEVNTYIYLVILLLQRYYKVAIHSSELFISSINKLFNYQSLMYDFMYTVYPEKETRMFV